MDSDTFSEQIVSSGLLIGIKFDVLTDEEMKKFSVISIEETNDVTDAKLGVPNPSSQCSTCGSISIKCCDGHFGVIELPATVYRPHFVSEIVRILNNVCPGCKSIRQKQRNKGSGPTPKNLMLKNERLGCKYCVKQANSIYWYPRMKFKVASEDSSGTISSSITVEVNEKLPKKFRRKNLSEVLPKDYWDFVPNVPQEQKNLIPHKIILSPYQVFCLLKEIDQKFIQKFVPRRELLPLNFFPITPNSHRVIETRHLFGNGSNLLFDERTMAYKRLAHFKRRVKEPGHHYPCGDDTIPSFTANHVLDCLNVSKLLTKEPSSTDSSRKSGSKWIKEVVLGKRTDCSFRMTVVGDPKIRLGEIGMSFDISEKLLIPVHVNSRNLKRLNMCCNLRLLQKNVVHARAKGDLISICGTNKLRIGDIVYRPLEDGDLVLINRPPTVHQHSLIAFFVKVLPIKSVVSINPLCCAPLRGDFDGDCLHGYIPQSINCRVELGELVTLNHQLVNGQDGRNLLSLNQDSLTAAHLVIGSEVFLNRFQMQQLEMLCSHQFQLPAILKAPLLKTPLWTGKQLLSMLLPQCFDFEFASNVVQIRMGETLSCSNESAWLRNTNTSIFSNLFKQHQSKGLDFLCAAQEVLCEWISSTRGLSVSLADVYLSSDSRTKMIDDVIYALQEAEHRCRAKELLVDRGVENLFKQGEGNQNLLNLKNRKSSSMNGVSESAFKEVFHDLQNVIRQYASKDNSLFAMVNAGSKGNLLKLVQQGACLGLQRSRNPLSFRIPYKLSCAEWNQQKVADLDQKAQDVVDCFGGVSYGVVENSFLSGLNPLECFIHALSSRGNCFSENADVPGTLNRKLMFYMRDLYAAYDGTVRSAYGNQLIQFSYEISEDKSIECEGFGGQPVGTWSACAISEAAYSALDQPINNPDTSPLLNLKKVFDCGLKKTNADQTMSLYLSQKLRRLTYGFEYGAIAVKSHLERVLFSDVISTVMIIFSKQGFCHGKTQISPWVSHFHICKERLKERGLNVPSIIDALSMKYNSMRGKRNSILPKLLILSRDCSFDEEVKHGGVFCISVVAEISESPILLDNVKHLVIPILLRTVIKGFVEFEKVDILWDDQLKASKFRKDSFGELFLKVYISETCERGKFWSVLQNACIQIMDLIDWERSHPDNIFDIFNAFGIDAAWTYFLGSLKVTLLNIGRDIHLQHLLIVADCLSVTGEFHGLNAKGIKQQRDQMSISSPFMQAFFSNPSSCFIKASKEGIVDDLSGTLDAVAWGKKAPIGTWAPFDILYSGKGHNLVKPEGIYETLCNQLIPCGDDIELKAPVNQVNISDNWYNQPVGAHEENRSEELPDLECKSNSILRSFSTWVDIVDMHISLRNILHKYPMNDYLNEADKSILMKALHFHPRRKEKMGTGPHEIKIGHNPAYPESRCFMLVRKDGTSEDFSYRKCVLGAAFQFSPEMAVTFRERLYRRYDKYIHL